MAILKTQIHQKTKGALGEKEDWWYLCYDVESQEFHVEHDWNHMNAYRVGEKANDGSERHALEGYEGPGGDKIEEGKALLLAKAGQA